MHSFYDFWATNLRNLHDLQFFEAILAVSLICLGILAIVHLLGRLLGWGAEFFHFASSFMVFPWVDSTLLIILGLFSGAILQGSVLNNALAYMGSTFLVFFLFILAISAGVTFWWRRRLGTRIQRAAVIWCACAMAFLFSGGLGWALYSWKKEAVHAYVARAVPVLKAMKARNGSYPTVLPVKVIGKPPSLLNPYESDGKNYSFSYMDTEGTWIDLYEYTNSKPRWREVSPPDLD